MPDSQLVDPFGRRITYLRLSVTDRCDFRCTYCMSEDMVFAPRAQILTLEELYAGNHIINEKILDKNNFSAIIFSFVILNT